MPKFRVMRAGGRAEEPRLDLVQDADGVERGSVENGHQRGLTTVFGDVAVTRKACRQRGHANLIWPTEI